MSRSIGYGSGDATLMVGGSTGVNLTNSMPFFVGKDAFKNNNAPLFLQPFNSGTSPGSLLYSGQTGLHISGTSFAPNNSGTPFYMNAPLSGSGILTMPLHMETFIPPTGAGGAYIMSGVFPIAMSGNNDASVFYQQNQESTLYLKANPYSSGLMPLYIEKAFANDTSLYMEAFEPQTIPLSVSGAFISNSGIDLYIYTPPNTGTTLFTHGYRE